MPNTIQVVKKNEYVTHAMEIYALNLNNLFDDVLN
jgi:hypothetical protein